MNLVVGIIVASLLGSVHCAAMCGPFSCLSAGPPASARGRWTAHVSYNLGRLVSYVMLGMAAGALGARVNDVGKLTGIGELAALGAGALLMIWAAGVIASAVGVRVPVTLAPEWARRLMGRVLLAARDQSPVVRALLVGLVTTLLPCGWLYTFVVVAAGTGSVATGALAMASFWVGTLPVLLLVGVGAAKLFGKFARRLPIVSAAVVFTLGVLAITGKLRAPSMPMAHVHHVSANVGH